MQIYLKILHPKCHSWFLAAMMRFATTEGHVYFQGNATRRRYLKKENFSKNNLQIFFRFSILKESREWPHWIFFGPVEGMSFLNNCGKNSPFEKIHLVKWYCPLFSERIWLGKFFSNLEGLILRFPALWGNSVRNFYRDFCFGTVWRWEFWTVS